MTAFPRRHLSSLHELAAQVLARRGVDGAPAAIARDLLAGFYDVCMGAGLDGVLHQLGAEDVAGLTEDERLTTELATVLRDRARFDPGGPRSALPTQLAACLIATLGLELQDPVAATTSLDDDIRRDTLAALAAVVEPALAAAQLRPAIIADARARCAPEHQKAFDKMAAQLDERGLRFPAQPKVPLSVVHEAQRALLEARTGIVERAANAALDRAKAVLERADADLAARIEQPISHRLTPREVAVRRAGALAIPSPENVATALLTGLTDVLGVVWESPAVAVRAYGVSQTFAVGEVIEHPKFGRGTVTSVSTKNVEVEFPDGAVTLVHARGK
jgi:hypothetical protein